jgi:hypothetical protein
MHPNVVRAARRDPKLAHYLARYGEDVGTLLWHIQKFGVRRTVAIAAPHLTPPHLQGAPARTLTQVEIKEAQNG